MKEILLYFALKYKGDWNKIYEALERKERVELDELERASKGLKSSFITILDKDYPKRLKAIYQPPFVLFYHGDLSMASQSKALGVIGSRKNSETGKRNCEKIISGLNEEYVIVSGLADGIDGIAHASALANDRKTVAILGGGINHIYPKSNTNLYEEIKKSGLIISEYPEETSPVKESFKTRNRLISGLSDGVLVVEAKLKSGTMNTVSHALNQGKDIFAIPDNIGKGSGTNSLIKQGAKLVDSVKDIEEEF